MFSILSPNLNPLQSIATPARKSSPLPSILSRTHFSSSPGAITTWCALAGHFPQLISQSNIHTDYSTSVHELYHHLDSRCQSRLHSSCIHYYVIWPSSVHINLFNHYFTAWNNGSASRWWRCFFFSCDIYISFHLHSSSTSSSTSKSSTRDHCNQVFPPHHHAARGLFFVLCQFSSTWFWFFNAIQVSCKEFV